MNPRKYRWGLALALTLLFAPAGLAATPLDLGKFEVRTASRSLLVAAPHGGFDEYTERIVREVADQLGANSITAVGFRTREHTINVNRPTEGVRLSSDKEAHTNRAEAIYEAYRSKVLQIHPSLYVEIHGSYRPESADAIEGAVVGFSATEAREIKAVSELPLKIEPIDPLYYHATAAKRQGVLSLMRHALHFELPASMRETPEARAKSVKALARIIEKAALLCTP